MTVFMQFETDSLLVFVMIFLSNFFLSFYLLLKVYRVIIFTFVTIEQIPTINPYLFPSSWIRVLTMPYFNFWLSFCPRVRLGKVVLDSSFLIAIEFLEILISVISDIRLSILIAIDQLASNA